MNSIEFLNNHYPDHTFIICGDYNIPEVSWDNDNNGLTYFLTSSSCACCVPEAFSALNFFQNNNIINCSNSILDLVFCNNIRLHYDTDSAFNILYDALHHSVLEIVPKFTFKESTYPPWFTKDLKHIILLSKKQAHTRFKSSKSITDYKQFSFLRVKFKYQSKKAYRCLLNR